MHSQSIARASNATDVTLTPVFNGGRRALASVVTVLGMLTAAFVALHGLQNKPVSVDRVSRGNFAQGLSAYLATTPCDKQKVVALAEHYLKAGEYRTLVNKAHAFSAQCGHYPRLQWLVYDAHKQLGQWKQATDVASNLIASDPSDNDYWSWRAQAHEQRGELELAVRDYRQALVLMPWRDHIPVNLATILETLDRPCEAVVPLKNYVVTHPSEQRVMQGRIDRLRRRGGGCRQTAALHGARRVR